MIKKLFFLMAALSFIPALSQDKEMKSRR